MVWSVSADMPLSSNLEVSEASAGMRLTGSSSGRMLLCVEDTVLGGKSARLSTLRLYSCARLNVLKTIAQKAWPPDNNPSA